MFSKKIILGSSSPRRKQLIQDLGLDCEIRKKEVEESFPQSMNHYDVPSYLAQLKAESLKSTIQEDEVLLTSDTVVVFNNEILHKPKNREEAMEALNNLSNTVNEVVTGVFLYQPKHEATFSVKTKVVFNALTDDEIAYYVNNYQPFDKAGAYGIQEWIGMIGVRKIEGCFYNVMGLPVSKVWETLNNEF